MRLKEEDGEGSTMSMTRQMMPDLPDFVTGDGDMDIDDHLDDDTNHVSSRFHPIVASSTSPTGSTASALDNTLMSEESDIASGTPGANLGDANEQTVELPKTFGRISLNKGSKSIDGQVIKSKSLLTDTPTTLQSQGDKENVAPTPSSLTVASLLHSNTPSSVVSFSPLVKPSARSVLGTTTKPSTPSMTPATDSSVKKGLSGRSIPPPSPNASMATPSASESDCVPGSKRKRVSSIAASTASTPASTFTAANTSVPTSPKSNPRGGLKESNEGSARPAKRRRTVYVVGNEDVIHAVRDTDLEGMLGEGKMNHDDATIHFGDVEMRKDEHRDDISIVDGATVAFGMESESDHDQVGQVDREATTTTIEGSTMRDGQINIDSPTITQGNQGIAKDANVNNDHLGSTITNPILDCQTEDMAMTECLTSAIFHPLTDADEGITTASASSEMELTGQVLTAAIATPTCGSHNQTRNQPSAPVVVTSIPSVITSSEDDVTLVGDADDVNSTLPLQDQISSPSPQTQDKLVIDAEIYKKTETQMDESQGEDMCLTAIVDEDESFVGCGDDVDAVIGGDVVPQTRSDEVVDREADDDEQLSQELTRRGSQAFVEFNMKYAAEQAQITANGMMAGTVSYASASHANPNTNVGGDDNDDNDDAGEDMEFTRAMPITTSLSHTSSLTTQLNADAPVYGEAKTTDMDFTYAPTNGIIIPIQQKNQEPATSERDATAPLDEPQQSSSPVAVSTIDHAGDLTAEADFTVSSLSDSSSSMEFTGAITQAIITQATTKIPTFVPPNMASTPLVDLAETAAEDGETEEEEQERKSQVTDMPQCDEGMRTMEQSCVEGEGEGEGEAEDMALTMSVGGIINHTTYHRPSLNQSSSSPTTPSIKASSTTYDANDLSYVTPSVLPRRMASDLPTHSSLMNSATSITSTKVAIDDDNLSVYDDTGRCEEEKTTENTHTQYVANDDKKENRRRTELTRENVDRADDTMSEMMDIETSPVEHKDRRISTMSMASAVTDFTAFTSAHATTAQTTTATALNTSLGPELFNQAKELLRQFGMTVDSDTTAMNESVLDVSYAPSRQSLGDMTSLQQSSPLPPTGKQRSNVAGRGKGRKNQRVSILAPIEASDISYTDDLPQQHSERDNMPGHHESDMDIDLGDDYAGINMDATVSSPAFKRVVQAVDDTNSLASPHPSSNATVTMTTTPHNPSSHSSSNQAPRYDTEASSHSHMATYNNHGYNDWNMPAGNDRRIASDVDVERLGVEAFLNHLNFPLSRANAHGRPSHGGIIDRFERQSRREKEAMNADITMTHDQHRDALVRLETDLGDELQRYSAVIYTNLTVISTNTLVDTFPLTMARMDRMTEPGRPFARIRAALSRTGDTLTASSELAKMKRAADLHAKIEMASKMQQIYAEYSAAIKGLLARGKADVAATMSTCARLDKLTKVERMVAQVRPLRAQIVENKQSIADANAALDASRAENGVQEAAIASLAAEIEAQKAMLAKLQSTPSDQASKRTVTEQELVRSRDCHHLCRAFAGWSSVTRVQGDHVCGLEMVLMRPDFGVQFKLVSQWDAESGQFTRTPELGLIFAPVQEQQSTTLSAAARRTLSSEQDTLTSLIRGLYVASAKELDVLLRSCRNKKELPSVAAQLNIKLSRFYDIAKELRTMMPSTYVGVHVPSDRSAPVVTLSMTHAPTMRQVNVTLDVSPAYPHCTFSPRVEVIAAGVAGSTDGARVAKTVRSRVVEIIQQQQGYGRLTKIHKEINNLFILP